VLQNLMILALAIREPKFADRFSERGTAKGSQRQSA